MMKNAVAGLALLASACATPMHQVYVDLWGTELSYRQTLSSSKGYELEACLEVRDLNHHSVADGVTIVNKFASSMLVPGYVLMLEGDFRLNLTQNGWILCNSYLYNK